MLVLTRKSNQSIMIGDEIEVSVLSVMGEKVRIGIQAPQKVPVFRKEIYLEIHREATGVTIADGNEPEKVAEVDDVPARARRGDAAALRSLPSTAERPTRRCLGLSSSGVRLAEQQVQRAEHHDRHDDGGQDQRQHQQPEAQEAALVTLLHFPLDRPLLGLASQRVAAAAIQRDLS